MLIELIICFISDSLITYGIQNRVLREAWGWAEGLSILSPPFHLVWLSQAVSTPHSWSYESALLAHVLIPLFGSSVSRPLRGIGLPVVFGLIYPVVNVTYWGLLPG